MAALPPTVRQYLAVAVLLLRWLAASAGQVWRHRAFRAFVVVATMTSVLFTLWAHPDHFISTAREKSTIWTGGQPSVERMRSWPDAIPSQGYPAGTRKKLAVVTIVTDPTTQYAQLSLLNKRYYAALHDYTFIAEPATVTDRPAVWSKLASARRALDLGFEWVWLLDLDTIITNQHIQAHYLTDAVPATHDVLIARDCNELNAGSVFLRNSPWTLEFLDRVSSSYGTTVAVDHPWQEQEAIIRLHHSDASVRQHILMSPQWAFNAYAVESSCQTRDSRWNRGDFVVHFANMMSPWYLPNHRMFMRYLQESTAMLVTSLSSGDESKRWVDSITQWWARTGALSPDAKWQSLS
ncbi:hypothetical protein RI367_001011 [Sorochytrium milnesiophthora]